MRNQPIREFSAHVTVHTVLNGEKSRIEMGEVYCQNRNQKDAKGMLKQQAKNQYGSFPNVTKVKISDFKRVS